MVGHETEVSSYRDTIRPRPCAPFVIFMSLPDRIQQSDSMRRHFGETTFKDLFLRYHTELCHFAAQYVGSNEAARDVVQAVFLKIWERRDDIDIHTSTRSYLYRAVRNHAINTAKQERRIEQILDEYAVPLSRESSSDLVIVSDLERRLKIAIEALPERQRAAFTLHRIHDLSYKEIADILEIAPKTVENHIGRALVQLRALLHEENP